MAKGLSDEEKELARLEAQLSALETEGEGIDYGYPQPPVKEDIFKFFKHLLGLKDTSKTGNLSIPELGQMKLTVRGYLDAAAYAESEDLEIVSDYLRNKAEIILSTSLSKKGFLPQLFVTQIRKEAKLKKEAEKPSKWFGKKKKEEET